LADDVLRRFGDADYSDTAFLRVIRDWACFDLGRAPGPQVEHPRPLHRQHLGTSVERRGIRLLATKGTELEAAQQFLDAAEAFRPYHRASEIRCRWAHGEALRRAGQLEAARGALEATEAVAAKLGMLAIGARIRRSLRLTGVRRSAQRARSGVLSAREREVLAGVAAGLTNGQIAARLGISRPTVARIVSNATAKLGASSRVEAAVAALDA
jgi:DNA-binding CsgD family transcriptional regulator